MARRLIYIVSALPLLLTLYGDRGEFGTPGTAAHLLALITAMGLAPLFSLAAIWTLLASWEKGKNTSGLCIATAILVATDVYMVVRWHQTHHS